MVSSTAQQVLKEMRLLVYELRPAAFEHEGLVEALRQRLETVENRAGVETDLILEKFIEPSIDVQVGLYRIAQEALNNALKHADATTVTICLNSDGKLLELVITDDGHGFDPENVRLGIGLESMKERTEKLGGVFNIISSSGKGTSIKVTLLEVFK
jgi:two-component system NarL family sensor kinase